jgi:hypothetical protein
MNQILFPTVSKPLSFNFDRMPTSELGFEFVDPFDSPSAEGIASEDNVRVILEEDVIAERMAQEAEDEDADALNKFLEKARKFKALDLPAELLSYFETIENLSQDAWAPNTLRVYRG